MPAPNRLTLITNSCAIISFAVAGLLAVFSCRVNAEDTLPLTAVNQANTVIDSAITAYGGQDKIAGLNSVIRKRQFTTWATNQSLRPGAPWDEGSQLNVAAVDFERQWFVGISQGSGGGYNFNNTQVTKGDEAWAVDHRGKTVTQQAQANFNTTVGPMVRVTAPLLVRELMNRRHTSHWLGEVTYDGRPHDVITLVMESGPALSLYFDKESNLLSRAERVLPPFGQVDYRFANYETIDDIPFAKDFRLYANGEPNLYIENLVTKVNQPIDKLAALPEAYARLETTPQPTEMALNELSEGVFLAGANGTYALFVEMDDHLVAIGGTAGIEDRIAALRAAGMDKPLRHAVLTHHHNDHLLGVTAYESEGATIYTVAENEEVVRASAAEGEALKLKFVEDRYVLETNGRRLELIDIGPTPHVEHLLVAWLPEEGILFEADHFPNPVNGQMPPAQPVTRALAGAIETRGLEVKSIVGAHSPRVATMDDLKASIALGNQIETAAR